MTRRKLLVLASLASALVAIPACAAVLGFDDTTLRDGPAPGEEGGPPTGEAGPNSPEGSVEEAGPTAKINVEPSPIVVRRGGTVSVKVTIMRPADVIADVGIAFGDLPAGVTVTPGTIPAGQTSVSLVVTASGAAELGSKVVTVIPSVPQLPAASVQLLVSETPGALDTTFDGDGFLTDGSKNNVVFRALALTGTSILAGGVGGNAWFLRKYTSAGAVDATFVANQLPNDGELSALAVDAQGRILCAGTSSAGALQPQQFTVLRLTAAGALDTTFGTQGIARLGGPDTTLFGSAALAVALDANGNVVVAGTRSEGADDSGVLVRFTSAGVRDMTFNGGQLVTAAKNRFVGVSADATGIVVAGTDNASNTPSYWLSRRKTTGELDSAFGAAGIFVFGTGFRANDFARMPDGSFVVVGDSQPSGAYTAGVSGPNGSVSFARSVATTMGASFQGVASVSDKRIIAAGQGTGAYPEARVNRLMPDGGADPTFGDGGTAIIDPGGVQNGFDVNLFAALVQPDGRILVAGSRTNAGGVIYRLFP